MWTEAASAGVDVRRAPPTARRRWPRSPARTPSARCRRGGDDDRALGVERVVEHERDGAAAEQAAGARRDLGEHVGQGLAVRDRALDLEQDLEQPVALAQRPAAGARAGAPRPVAGRDAAQGEPEHAGHADQQLALVGAEGVRAGRRRAGAGPVAVQGGAGHVAAPQARQLERSRRRRARDERGPRPEAGRGGQRVADDDGADAARSSSAASSAAVGSPLGALVRADGGQELDELMRRALGASRQTSWLIDGSGGWA